MKTSSFGPGSSSAPVLHLSFVLTGVVTNLLGALLPILSSRWGLNDTQSGYLITAQFTGMLTGNMVSGRSVARLGLPCVLATGFLLMASGVVGISLNGWGIAVASVLLYGLGLGLTVPPTNLFVAEINPHRSAAALNVLNVAWVVGAVSGPPIITAVATRGYLVVALLVLGVCLSIIALRLLRTMPGLPSAGSERAVGSSGTEGSIWYSPVAFVIGALIFLYVGTETAIAGWVATYTQRATNVPPAAWALAQSAFWANVLAGRSVAPLVLRRLAGEKLVLGGLALAGCGAVLLIGSTSQYGHWTGIMLIGIGLAPVFPTTIAIYSRFFGARATGSAGLVFALGGLGGASLPWMVGFFSNRTGSLRTGMTVPLISMVGMILLQMLLIPLLSRSMPREGKLKVGSKKLRVEG